MFHEVWDGDLLVELFWQDLSEPINNISDKRLGSIQVLFNTWITFGRKLKFLTKYLFKWSWNLSQLKTIKMQSLDINIMIIYKWIFWSDKYLTHYNIIKNISRLTSILFNHYISILNLGPPKQVSKVSISIVTSPLTCLNVSLPSSLSKVSIAQPKPSLSLSLCLSLGARVCTNMQLLSHSLSLSVSHLYSSQPFTHTTVLQSS